MTSKRSKLEIYLDILKVIKKGTHKPTRIMYKTNLSWKPLMTILEALVDQGFIETARRENRITYEITDKGKEILRYFETALNSIKIV
jgi:predicted transcriptional regulator